MYCQHVPFIFLSSVFRDWVFWRPTFINVADFLPLFSTSGLGRVAQITQKISTKKSITEDINEQAGSQRAPALWVSFCFKCVM